MNAPPLTEDFVEWLEALVPEPCFDPGHSREEVMFTAGRRSVVVQVMEAFLDQQGEGRAEAEARRGTVAALRRQRMGFGSTALPRFGGNANVS